MTPGEVFMPQQIIDFWFADEVRKLWFKSTAEFDRTIGLRFEDILKQAERGELDHWMESAEGCLALVIILDQFPLNMYRGSAQSYATEAQSREVARVAIEKGFDQTLSPEQQAFMYMPFMHSEELADQELALDLFDQPGMESNLRFARHHHAIVQTYGRFPHRNTVLGRTSTAAEIEYLNSREAFTG
jgi:uncharacterized protein (DUF924 family)